MKTNQPAQAVDVPVSVRCLNPTGSPACEQPIAGAFWLFKGPVPVANVVRA
jgi:hypothetical protein